MPVLDVLNDELIIGEGLRWHDDHLYLSDWGANQVLAIDEDGKSEVILEGGEVLQTFELTRMGFACTLGAFAGKTLFVAQAEWKGPEHMFDGPRTGQVVRFPAPARHAGHP